ncbi:MAG: hypothetical protein K9L70_14695, partial [Thiohalocapsa sp.]|nr:hypothetical protein [Thiohalocapsa sp.]
KNSASSSQIPPVKYVAATRNVGKSKLIREVDPESRPSELAAAAPAATANVDEAARRREFAGKIPR